LLTVNPPRGTSEGWPNADTQPSRLIVHCTHITNIRHAESTVAETVEAISRSLQNESEFA
jgi:hypothetical protein